MTEDLEAKRDIDARIKAFRELAQWSPGWPSHAVAAYDDPPPNNCPFFTEAFLYELLGKDDARTLQALMNRACLLSIGVRLDEILQTEQEQ